MKLLNRRTVLLLPGVIFTVAGTTGVVYLSTHDTEYAMAPTDEAALISVGRIALLAALALLGCASSAVWESVPYATSKGPPERINYKVLIPIALTSPGLVKSLLVSPIVFAGVYWLVRPQPDPVIQALIAFENGFFWNTVLRTRRESLQQQNE